MGQRDNRQKPATLTELDVVWDSSVASFTITSFSYAAIVLVSMNLSNNHFDPYFPVN